MDYNMLVSDSVVCGAAIFLSYKLFISLRTELFNKNNEKVSFGSSEWWEWVDYSIIGLLLFFGTSGLSIVETIHTIEQASHLASPDEDTIEIIINIFTTIILLASTLYVNNRKEQIDWPVRDRRHKGAQ